MTFQLLTSQPGKKIGRQKLLNTVKVAWGVSGNKLKFRSEFNVSVSFGGKTYNSEIYVPGKTYNSEIYVVPGNNPCLFSINWIELFDPWEMPINSLCNKSDATENKRNPDK